MLLEITLRVKHLACNIEILVLVCWILLLDWVWNWILVNFSLPSLNNYNTFTYFRTVFLSLFRVSLLGCRSLNCGLVFATSQHLTHIEKVASFIAFVNNSCELLVDLIGRANFVFSWSIKAVDSSRYILDLCGVTCITRSWMKPIRAILLDIKWGIHVRWQ